MPGSRSRHRYRDRLYSPLPSVNVVLNSSDSEDYIRLPVTTETSAIVPTKRKSDAMDDADVLDEDFVRSIGSQIVTLNVGKDKESIQVDKSILCKHVPYFKAAFNGNWTEAKSHSIDLLDEEPASVRAFLLWIYAGASPHTLPTACLVSYDMLMKLFLMAEKWMMDSLVDLVHGALHNRFWELKDEQACYQQWLLARDSRIRFLPLISFVQLLGCRTIDAEDPESLKSEMEYDAEFLKETLLYRLRLGNQEPQYPPCLEELRQKPLGVS